MCNLCILCPFDSLSRDGQPGAKIMSGFCLCLALEPREREGE